MDKEGNNAAIIIPTTNNGTTTMNNNNNNNKSQGKAKKHGPLHVLKVALFMLRRRSNKKSNSIHVEVASKGIWKKLVSAMRPLHHHQLPNQNSPPPSSIYMGPINMDHLINNDASKGNDSFHDMNSQSPMSSPHVIVHGPGSPSSSSSSSGSDDSMSRYASAQNLQELDRSEDQHNNCDFVIEGDEHFYGGDDLIDVKAEEFIAQFYEQMRLQQLDLMNRYNERKKKQKEAIEGY